MKIALRIVGGLYLIYDLLHVLQITRILSLYQQFGAEVPTSNLILLPLGIFIWGIFLFLVSSSTRFSHRAKIALLILSILAPSMFFIYGLVLPIYSLTSQY